MIICKGISDNYQVYIKLVQQYASQISCTLQNYCMTQVQRLIHILQANIPPKKDMTSSLRYETENEEQHFQQLKAQMTKYYRPAWISTGIAHRKQRHLALKHKQLDNWQISRMSLAKRSYVYPKDYHGFKIPAVGRNFSTFNSKDAEGHLPYLYEGDMKKINKIREELHKSTLVRTNTVRHQYFGFEKIRANKTQMGKNKLSSHSLG